MFKNSLITVLKHHSKINILNSTRKYKNIFVLKLMPPYHTFTEKPVKPTNETKEEPKSNQIPTPASNLKLISQLSRWDLKDLILNNKNEIKNNKFFIRSLPDPNKFGEALLYKSPISLLHKCSKISLEYSGFATISLVTILNYYGLLFPSAYLFPYLVLLSLTAAIKHLTQKNVEKYIYEITLLNEHQVKITYINGYSNIVDIKNIYLSQENVDVLLGSENLPKNYTPEQISKTPLALSLRIGQEKAFLLLRQSSIIENSHFRSFCEIKLLLGILDKEVKKLAIAE